MPKKLAKILEDAEKEIKKTIASAKKEEKGKEKETKTKLKTTKSKETKTKAKETKSKVKKEKTEKPEKEKKAETKKSSAKATKTTTKKTSTRAKKSSSEKTTARKTSSRSKKAKEEEEVKENANVEVAEYYDLPYRYDQTVIKMLAQTPTTLFIYWDISDKDRAKFIEQYGDQFFNNTKPVLVVHNNTLHYSFEIDIDDFANSWYLHVNDANCNYSVELGRRAKYYNNEEKSISLPNNYLYLTSSNTIDSPNDHVLFDKDLKTVYFMDTKTNIITEEDITSVSFFRNIGRIYNLYDLHTDFTANDWLNNKNWQLDFRNPSSGNPSSTFK